MTYAMSKVQNFITIALLLAMTLSCRQNDPLRDHATMGEVLPNLYFVPVDPVARAGSTILCELEYWSVQEDIETIFLDERLRQSYEVELDIVDALGTVTLEWEEDPSSWQEAYSGAFDEADWVSNRSAYVRTVDYAIPADLASKKWSSRKVDKAEFSAILPDTVGFEVFQYLVKRPSKLRRLMVEKWKVVDATEFDNCVDDDGRIKTECVPQLFDKWEKVDAEQWLGRQYEMVRKYSIQLRFRIRIQSGEQNTSRIRTVKVL